MNILQSLHRRKDSRLRDLVSTFLASLSFIFRYNTYTVRFALYTLPASEYSPDNLREALQLLH